MPKIREVKIGDLSTQLTRCEDDSILLNAKIPLEPYPLTILQRLQHWALHSPNNCFIAQRETQNKNNWRRLSYSETLLSCKRIATALSKFNLSKDSPIAILSGNSIEHGLLGLSAMYLGIPYAPISPQYSLASSNYSKLKQVLDLITPGLVFVDDATLYANAILATLPQDVLIVCLRGDVAGRTCISFDDLLTNEIDNKIDFINEKIRPDDIAKFLFSSGSTGSPKAVINTHRMLMANQQMIVQAYPFLKVAPVLVDWLPWNHTFGGNHNFGIALYNGGTYYIDDGKPVPALFSETVKNLKEIAPTVYFNVPKGFEMLVQKLREDSELRELFFSKVKILFYAGAGLSQPVWDALEELALSTCGEKIMILTGLGCTETGPSAIFTNSENGFAGWIGLPLHGMEVKLKKVGNKHEICFRGDNVTPGYWRAPELTQKAFDEEGFFTSGDAVKFVSDDDPQKGLVFDGRISEDFKLNTGTWVSAGPMRAKFLNHFGPLVKDIVIVGRDRASVGALVFPDLEYCKSLLNDVQINSISDENLLQLPEIQSQFKNLLSSFSLQSSGSAGTIERLALTMTPPALDKGEITDKGSLNASAIQDNRKADIDSLYQQENSEKLLVL